MSVQECDEEVVDFAVKHECMAIFGQDTDFVVSDLGDTIILSSNQFDIKRMNTLRYDREKLAQVLQISCAQLPLLAIIAGNDVISHDWVKVSLKVCPPCGKVDTFFLIHPV